MKVQVLADAEAVAREGARFVAELARVAAAERGCVTLALSGGETPWKMLRALSAEDVPWDKVHIFQVDERIAPDGDPLRNLTHLHDSLLANLELSPNQVHAMPVQQDDLDAAATRYASDLATIAGSPPVLDLVHLGLGSDGHSASLVPGDPVLQVGDRDVAVTGDYQGTRRMTLTYPLINRARQILWLATGESKAPMLSRLYHGDPDIPAGRVRANRATLLADGAAARLLKAT
ncbi:MAG: 6-phosphogluconolactonase [Gammaproteobacteria bacterium]|nr:6-phosphogluconolactonase [Gammaproteobacteria bacterium]